ncbi:uroporphyrinogen decarboxylase family protein [Mahella australiensis]|uniref:Uroporphyrinogen decarboxylase (URO-D) domain-containing protein n=1 Tax=Mahella australiensis (strain DSM 15567 / CIP 107919 / 50-1 BON) TaxID=697281 RepID=F3ZYQ3_MAHA5|nr:uroporphyrinogen decarboxylase family protein [Mahella australiensis]AEE97821.1 hypothetical protein Mahau_2685 [Mahella australiensis 50-1 BON]
MTSYERIKAAVSHKRPDRVPCDFSAEKDVIENLKAYFSIDDMDDLLDVLGVDRRHVAPRYVGPPLRTFEDGSYETGIFGGPRKKDIPAPGGGVIETPVYFPWGDIETTDDLKDRYGTMGDMSWWDFTSIPNQIDELEDRGQYWITTHGDPAGLQHICQWVGDEKFMMILALDDDLAMAMIEKANEHRLEHAIKALEAGGGRIHELNGGGDYGNQNSLMISKGMFRKYFKPLYVKFYKEIKDNFDVEIFFHSCGSVVELIPELIEVGVTILDPVQVSARGMEIEKLKREYGSKLTFHGAIDIQQLLPYASEEELRREVRRIISVLGDGGGYILAPTHAIQADTTIANIIAMYEEAQGRKISI